MALQTRISWSCFNFNLHYVFFIHLS